MVPQRLYCKESFIASIPLLENVTQGPSPQGAGFLYKVTASGNVASMREPLDGSLWWYWIAANAAKKNGASFKNYHRLSHPFYFCGVQIRQSLLCNMRDWSQG